MKIAVISFSFFESSIPLAKHIAEHEDVTLFCLFSRNHLNPPLMDIRNMVQGAYGVIDHESSKRILPENIVNYLYDSTLSINLVIYSNGFYDFNTINKLANILNRGGYDVVHFIGHHISLFQLHLSIRSKVIIHTLHEGNVKRLRENRLLKNFLVKRLYSYLGAGRISLIFHSEPVRREFLSLYKQVESVNTRVIPFGLFEIYKYVKPATNFGIPKNQFIFLFFGYILPYKGVDLLLEAARIIEMSFNTQIKFVIAGKDGIGIHADEISTNVMIIDKFLSEAEIVELIKKSDCIIMPYRSMSQSGIPNVSYCFTKPILASNLEMMRSLIQDSTNGFLFETGMVDELVKKILSIWEDRETLEFVKFRISKGDTNILDWNTISNNTLNFYNQIFNQKK